MKFLSILPIAVTVVGAYFLVKLRAFFILHPKRVIKKLSGLSKGENSIRSFLLALAGTLGVGNIVGVAVGISVGGAGSVFWLLVSSVFATVIKYCESAISCDRGSGLGMIGVIRASFGKKSSIIYAALALLLCFVMGAALQSASIAQCASSELKELSPILPFIIVLSLIPAILVGAEKIEKITAYIIPIATIIYIFLCLSAIFMNIERLPSVIFMIVRSAFTAESVGGGILGFLLSSKIREGYLRGILSNEAGAGTSSLAHARNSSPDAGLVGAMGMLEVLFDTVILCMMTAFATLLTAPQGISEMSGIEIIMRGLGSVYGAISSALILLCIFAFAYSTVICWYYYGSCAWRYLFSGGESAFLLLFLTFVYIGSLVKGDSLIAATDVIILFLSLISMSALIKNSDRIRHLSEQSDLVIIRR